jgi:hypothetical protein
MRRILVESARKRAAEKRGAGRVRVPLSEADAWYSPADEELLAIDEALDRLAVEDPPAARFGRIQGGRGRRSDQFDGPAVIFFVRVVLTHPQDAPHPLAARRLAARRRRLSDGRFQRLRELGRV